MDELLAALRHEATRDVPSRLGPLCGQAAAEIERLRKVLEEIATFEPRSWPSDAARMALGRRPSD